MPQSADQSTVTPDNGRSDSIPIAVRLVCIALGVLLLVVSIEIGSSIFEYPPDAKEIFGLCLLAIGTVALLSFSLPKKQMLRIWGTLTLVGNLLAVVAGLWQLEGYWRWATALVIAVLATLGIKFIQNQRGLNSSRK